jgi:hypothetical protein
VVVPPARVRGGAVGVGELGVFCGEDQSSFPLFFWFAGSIDRCERFRSRDRTALHPGDREFDPPGVYKCASTLLHRIITRIVYHVVLSK